MPAFKNPFGKKGSSKKEDDVLADIEVGDELGRGGFSIVKAVHRIGEEKGFLTAMKITPLALIESSMGMTRAQTKASLERMRKVSDMNTNTHIISFIDWRMSKTDLFTFSELCSGGDLFEKIVNSPTGRLSEEEAKGAARNLLGAVFDIHRQGIIHRDIKPENIFYRFPDSPAEDVILADFGCCVDECTPQSEVRGTAGSPGYLPPEMAAGQPYNMLVDEWSTGVTVYEMLTGRSPFISQEPEQLSREVLERAIPYPKQYWGSLSPEARMFTQKLLEKDPRKRMTAEQALKHPWLSGLELERTNSIESEMSDLTMESDGSDLTRVATSALSRTSIPRAASFGRPDPLAGICTRCILGKTRTDTTKGEMINTAQLTTGKLTSADAKKLAALNACSQSKKDVLDAEAAAAAQEVPCP